jgi:hypothetical protein
MKVGILVDNNVCNVMIMMVRIKIVINVVEINVLELVLEISEHLQWKKKLN